MGRYTPDGVNQHVSSLRLYFRWLHEEGLVPANPAARLRFLRPPVKPVESLSEAECKRLARWCSLEAPKQRFGTHRTACLALLLLDCGLRVGEALRPTMPDLDFEQGQLLVRASKTRDFRVLPLSLALRRPLRRYLARREEQLARRCVESAVVFVSESGRPCNGALVLHSFEHLGRVAGLERHLHPHLLRHTFATRCLLNGAPLPAVMRLGGWRRLSTVQRYVYLNDEALAEVHSQTGPLSRL